MRKNVQDNTAEDLGLGGGSRTARVPKRAHPLNSGYGKRGECCRRKSGIVEDLEADCSSRRPQNTQASHRKACDRIVAIQVGQTSLPGLLRQFATGSSFDPRLAGGTLIEAHSSQ